MRVVVADSYSAVPDSWDTLDPDGSPFTELAFLQAMEQTECAVPDTGWGPRPVLVYDDNDVLVAGAPAYLKSHSMGEFVYDHSWAHAADGAGIAYYPKLIVGSPFSPVTGSRLRVAKNAPEGTHAALLRGLQEAARGTNGMHVLFNTQAESERLQKAGGFTRLQYQYWWHNHNYASYDDFIGAFRAKPRKKIRHERRAVQGLRFERVLRPSSEQMDHLFRFYSDTCNKHYYGRQYLNHDFFDALQSVWGDRILAVLAYDGDRCIAGALDVVKGDRLYGRYWGCDEEVKFLHFEVCYHQGIEFAIENKLSVFEPGHGGEHKYRRGFTPEITYSNHWLAHPGLHQALHRHSNKEAKWVHEQVALLDEQSPYRTEERQ